MQKLKVLDLFSGIGGFSLGLERTGGFETVAFCEIEKFPQDVLRKHWPDVPIFDDVRKLKGSDIGAIDIICGGYPCQPFSTAEKRRGAEDDRHLWPEFSRLVAELRPTWVIGENVAGHISMGLDSVLSNLEGQGYACRTFVIPACAVDAKHRRDRVWTVAHSNGFGIGDGSGKVQGAHEKVQQRNDSAEFGDTSTRREAMANTENVQRNGGREYWEPSERQIPEFGEGGGEDSMADPNDAGLQRRQKAGNAGGQRARCNKLPERCADLPRSTWLPEPDVGRVANGVPRRVDRLKALGNAVVPQIPEMIGRAILAAEIETQQRKTT